MSIGRGVDEVGIESGPDTGPFCLFGPVVADRLLGPLFEDVGAVASGAGTAVVGCIDIRDRLSGAFASTSSVRCILSCGLGTPLESATAGIAERVSGSVGVEVANRGFGPFAGKVADG